MALRLCVGLFEMNYNELKSTIKEKIWETNRLSVCPFRSEDEDGLFELFQDENTMRMDGDTPLLEKNEEFKRRIELVKNGPLIWFFYHEKLSSEFVGYVMLQDEGDAVALGFAITASKQHMGYGTEMLGSLVDVLKENGVKNVRIKTWEKNTACQKLAEKCGFKKINLVKNNHKDLLTGDVSDSYLYSLEL